MMEAPTGLELRALRESKGISQLDAGKRVSIGQTSLVRYERGDREMDPYLWVRYKAALDALPTVDAEMISDRQKEREAELKRQSYQRKKVIEFIRGAGGWVTCADIIERTGYTKNVVTTRIKQIMSYSGNKDIVKRRDFEGYVMEYRAIAVSMDVREHVDRSNSPWTKAHNAIPAISKLVNGR